MFELSFIGPGWEGAQIAVELAQVGWVRVAPRVFAARPASQTAQ